jgi:hypothetical protein
MVEEIEITAYDRNNYFKSWNKQFEKVIKTDEISTEERNLLKKDPEFDKLILEKKTTDRKIIAYIEKVIRENRTQEAVKLSQIKPIKAAEFKEPFE